LSESGGEDSQDGQDGEEMMNDECGMMNKRQTVFHSSLIIPHSSFVFHPVYPVNDSAAPPI
jgi:hypothetical protein